MRQCLDEGMLQSYFDGELPAEQLESASAHLAACGTCSAAARELENENNLLATALAPEVEAAVPTERLRQRIDAAIAGMRVVDVSNERSTRSWFQSVASLFTFAPQRAFGYAGLAVVLMFGVVFGIVWRQAPSVGNVASTQPTTKTTPDNPGVRSEGAVATVIETSTPIISATPSYVAQKNRPGKQQVAPARQAVAEVKLLPGERSYLKTIAALDTSIKARSNRPMRPSLQAEYERNLAVVNRALAATRNAAKKNPNDPDAAEFMFAAYQSKVDLLNTVADARVYNRQQ